MYLGNIIGISSCLYVSSFISQNRVLISLGGLCVFLVVKIPSQCENCIRIVLSKLLIKWRQSLNLPSEVLLLNLTRI